MMSENNTLFSYKSMPQFHKDNIKNYYIYDGIFTVSPSITDEEAQMIFEVCLKCNNENINPYSIAYFLTDNYVSGNITKEEMLEASSGDISEAVFYDNLNYFTPIKRNNHIEIEDEISK